MSNNKTTCESHHFSKWKLNGAWNKIDEILIGSLGGEIYVTEYDHPSQHVSVIVAAPEISELKPLQGKLDIVCKNNIYQW